MTAHRYRLGDVVIDRVEDAVWIAPLPSGPIMLLQGVSPLVVDVLAAADSPLTPSEVLEGLRALVADVPADAEAIVAVHLTDLAEHGVLEAVADGA